MKDGPDFGAEVKVEGAKSFATRADFDESVKKAENGHDGGKEGAPSVCGSLPTIDIDGLRLVFRVHIECFKLELTIGFG